MAKERTINPIQGFKTILTEILNGPDILYNTDDLKNFFPPEDNKTCLNMIIPIEFINKEKKHIYDRLFGKDRSRLSNFMTGDNGNGVLGERDELSKYIFDSYDNYIQSIPMDKYNKIFSVDNICAKFELQKMPMVYDALIKVQETYKNDKSTVHLNESIALDYVRKYLLFLYGKKCYPEFFHLLFLFSILQVSICTLVNKFPRTQYKELTKIFDRTDNKSFNLRQSPSMCIEEFDFYNVRRELVKSAKGHLIIAGVSLRDAFRRGDSNEILNALIEAIRNHQLTRLSILLTDPSIFEESKDCGEPLRDIDGTIKSLQENIYIEINREKEMGYDMSLHIYFLPLLQIDHAVLTEEFLAFRTNKLWNYDRLYKGSYMLYAADYYYGTTESEYKAHLEYLNMIMNNSTVIYPDVDVDDPLPERFSPRSYHMEWREFLRNSIYDNIFLHKVYEKQIFSYVYSTWSPNNGRIGEFTPNSHIEGYSDLFKPENLLNDKTQKVLLPYIQETEYLFTEAIKKHDQSKNSFCHIIPSLDLGFPNNVQRLAGGFATGMLVTWNCGIDMVPIDATVNICTSSVYKLDKINPQWITNPVTFYDMIKEYSQTASEEKGYSFSFTTGNHFLLLARDSSTNEHYIVMHSSANELKHSYMGLYPVEGNWYSDKIKHIEGKNGRYFRYLKDEDARYFIRMVKNFQRYNEQIHFWLAMKINGGEFSNNENWMGHHYYMPTNQSIAIGTFAEPIGTQLPIFSAYQKPVYIFEIGPDNFQINLGEKKGKVCLVPHGWGQEIEHVTNIRVDKENRDLIISTKKGNYPSQIKSQEHIECSGKKIRQFKDGEEFLRLGSNYVQGKIVKTLIPICEYSQKSIKAMEKEKTK
ncbi:MAG: hypothetical protein HDQ99_04450 [Lachnospiraceae bacterium]|nr:hypothetical protein [Lachnospiraceae bacterium]